MPTVQLTVKDCFVCRRHYNRSGLFVSFQLTSAAWFPALNEPTKHRLVPTDMARIRPTVILTLFGVLLAAGRSSTTSIHAGLFIKLFFVCACVPKTLLTQCLEKCCTDFHQGRHFKYGLKGARPSPFPSSFPSLPYPSLLPLFSLSSRGYFQRERLGTAFPKLFWQWARRSQERRSQERNSPLVIYYTFVNTPQFRPNSLCFL